MLRNPSNAELARLIGLRPRAPRDDVCDLSSSEPVPPGSRRRSTAPRRAWRRSRSTQSRPGGQAGTSSKIENYLGFPSGISGAELAERADDPGREVRRAHQRARRGDSARRSSDGHYVVRLDDGEPGRARTVVIATGARYRKLDVPRIRGVRGHERLLRRDA